ncbi:hypothetical protein F5Y10DRAFT_109863 [Nemania abortiva]|nr:hypothetical protein F5Y10DRAFT_109863 [Nemania abortiva]
MTYIKFRGGRFLVPARDSRHRIACFALYRALLRLAPQVKLPDELATGWGAGRNPIIIQIQRAFRRNVADTSPRIVYPALTAGYRMLSVLQDAATSPSSEHHASITTFLHTRLAERQRSLANRPLPNPSPKPGSPRPGTLPLLENITPAPSPRNPDPKPAYATPHRPRPQSALGGTGRRKVPRLDMAGDFPFLRFTKPPPAQLSRVLGQKIVRRAERQFAVQEMEEEKLPDARLEDQWDVIVDRLQAQEESAKQKRKQKQKQWDWDVDAAAAAADAEEERSHASTVKKYGVATIMTTLFRERVDAVARADAMRRLVIQEKALAEQEKAQRDAGRRAQWEARMREEHGEGWQDLFPKLKEREASGRQLEERRANNIPSRRP